MKVGNIEEFVSFSVRTSNALMWAGIETAEQLIQMDFRSFAKQRNVGAKVMAEIAEAVVRISSGKFLRATAVLQAQKEKTSLKDLLLEREKLRKLADSMYDCVRKIDKELLANVNRGAR
jgi:hypothetical protein